MKTKNTAALVALMRIRNQIGNVEISRNPLFDYDEAMENLEIAIEIVKMNVVNEFAAIRNRQ